MYSVMYSIYIALLTCDLHVIVQVSCNNANGVIVYLKLYPSNL